MLLLPLFVGTPYCERFLSTNDERILQNASINMITKQETEINPWSIDLRLAMNIKSPFPPSLFLSIIELMKSGNKLIKTVLLFAMPWPRAISERIVLANSNSCMFLNRTLSGELPSETRNLELSEPNA